MHFSPTLLLLTLSSSTIFASSDVLTPTPNQARDSKETFSRIKRRCPLPTEEDPNPPCHPIHPPPPPQDPTVHSYTINDPEINKVPVNFKVTVPDTLTVGNWDQNLLSNVKATLPSILTQLYVDPNQVSALVDEGIPYLLEAMTAVQSGLSLPDTESDLVRRGLFSKIGKWLKKVVTAIVRAFVEAVEDKACEIFADITLPGYLFSDLGFATLNLLAAGDSTTPDQDYFINPLHGSLSHDDDVKIYYDATFSPGFGSADAVTFGRSIYMRANGAATTAAPPLVQASAFQSTTKTLLHEFTHVKQYKDVFYNHAKFGTRYLYAYCRAGFDYKEDALEKEAYQKQEQDNGILYDGIGTQFFDKWKRNNWAGPFGSPTQTNFRSYAGIPGQYFLPFQNGGLTLVCNSAGVCV